MMKRKEYLLCCNASRAIINCGNTYCNKRGL